MSVCWGTGSKRVNYNDLVFGSYNRACMQQVPRFDFHYALLVLR